MVVLSVLVWTVLIAVYLAVGYGFARVAMVDEAEDGLYGLVDVLNYVIRFTAITLLWPLVAAVGLLLIAIGA